MQLHIKTTEKNKTVVTELTRKFFPGGGGPENVVARIALAYSLARGVKLDVNGKQQDSKGKEYKEDTLLGQHKAYYIALLCQHYGIYKEDHNLATYLKMHVDDGLTRLNSLFEDSSSYSGLDFLMEHIERGTNSLVEAGAGMVNNYNQQITKGFFSGPLSLRFGRTLGGPDKNSEPIWVVLNDTKMRNNGHLAVAGNSGTGKTRFALDLLRQISEVSHGEINFLYLDFKGLNKDDVKKLKPFFDKTNTTFIDAPQQPFPLNPLTFIDNVNEKNRLMGISKFVDIITTYAPRMGATQTQLLKDATRNAFISKKGGAYPSLGDVYEHLMELTSGKRDTLTEIMQNLGELEIFAAQQDLQKSFINRNYYFSLSGDLNKTLRFTSTFLTVYYLYNTFMNMPDAPVENGLQALRYVLLIDEAHVLFKDKKSQELLESILREIRSKGVVVMLLSQGIEEFNQPTFDFSSLCENAVLLDIKDKSNIKTMSRFLGLGDIDSKPLVRSMEKIERGQAVTNVKEFKKGELFEVEQY